MLNFFKSITNYEWNVKREFKTFAKEQYKEYFSKRNKQKMYLLMAYTNKLQLRPLAIMFYFKTSGSFYQKINDFETNFCRIKVNSNFK